MSERSESRLPSLVTAPSDDALAGQGRLTRPPDRRHQRSWVPLTPACLCLLIGLADIAQVVLPRVYVHTHLHKINPYVPGTLTNLTRTVDVLTGLLLLMLSHGLRRRKRRAWQAVVLLLAFSVVVHLAHFPRMITAVVAASVLVALLYFRDEFYAVGDPRTRWRALVVFAGLVVAGGGVRPPPTTVLPRLLRSPQRQERHLVIHREVLHRLPGGVRGDARGW